MMKLLLSFLCISFFQAGLLADTNQEFVDAKLKKISKIIEKGEFVDAQLYINNDTVNTKILQFANGDAKLFHFLCIEQKEDEAYKIYFAKDIDGFSVLGDFYVKILWQEKDIFIKRIAFGNISLYEKKALPSDAKYLYFLHKNGSNNIHVINPGESDVRAMGTNTKNEDNISMVVSEVIGLHDAFVRLVIETMGDCEKVNTMIKTDYYLRDDLIDLVKVYNKCF